MFARLGFIVILIFAVGCGGGVGPQAPEEDAALTPQSSTIQVTTTADEFNFNSDCSLREAIYVANLGLRLGACNGRGVGPKTIVLQNGQTYNLIRQHAQLRDYDYIESTLPVITGDITIEGNNSFLYFEGDANQNLNLITVAPRGRLHLDSLLIGKARSGHRDAVENNGTLTGRRVHFRDNQSTSGNTLGNTGRLTLSYCSFNNNHSDRGAAGIYSFDYGINARASVQLDDCTFRQNTSDVGVAALYNSNGSLMRVKRSAVVENRIEDYVPSSTSARSVPSVIRNGDNFNSREVSELELENVTLSESRGPVYSALANFEKARITHGTIYKNHSTINAKASRGIYNAGELEIGHTIVAHHQPRNGAGAAWSDCMGTAVNSTGYNFQSDGSCAFDATGDIEEEWGSAGLTDLGYYGNSTVIHRHVGWVLHNAGAPRTNASTDQHGDARVQDGRADIGAYEMCEDPDITWWFFTFKSCDDASLRAAAHLSVLEHHELGLTQGLAKQLTQ